MTNKTLIDGIMSTQDELKAHTQTAMLDALHFAWAACTVH